MDSTWFWFLIKFDKLVMVVLSDWVTFQLLLLWDCYKITMFDLLACCVHLNSYHQDLGTFSCYFYEYCCWCGSHCYQTMRFSSVACAYLENHFSPSFRRPYMGDHPIPLFEHWNHVEDELIAFPLLLFDVLSVCYQCLRRMITQV